MLGSIGQMHKTSSLTFIYKYVLPVVSLTGFVIMAWILFENHGIKWYIGTILIMSWAIIYNVYHSTWLKNATIDESGIQVSNSEVIKYEQLIWVKFISISPTYIFIRYLDEDSYKHLLLIPEISINNILSRDKPHMYDFLRDNATKSNSGNFQASKTSAFKQIAGIISLGLITFLVVVLFFYGFIGT
jgi:hypothetical protein